MPDYPKVTAFKTPQAFREYVRSENFHIDLVDEVRDGGKFAEKVEHRGRLIGNRWAILPMEGWDCLPDGSPSDLTERRWLRFAESGAKLIYGTEAAAVMHEGRSNTRQLWFGDHTYDAMAYMLEKMRKAHKARFGTADDLYIGIQLTHSGRFAHPNDDAKLESRTAYAHPLLDKKFHNGPANVVSDGEVRHIIEHFHHAAKLAYRAGFDFVDIKHAHGYLGHEFLSAYDRPGDYGGSFENRTRFFREIAEGIRSEAPDLEISMRLSLADFFPFYKGEDGVGRAMEWEGPYPYAFGGDGTGCGFDLAEPVKFVKMAQEKFGVSLICATIGSPYYNVHIQRPAYYPVSDGYLMPEPPLKNVGRHIEIVAGFKKLCPDVKVVGSGYTCLQEYLPNVGQYVLEHDMADFIGIGRMVLSYPEMCADSLAGKVLDRCKICRTFGDCTNAPRHGMVSGCYPLDQYYKIRPEALKLKEIKAASRAR